MINDENTLHAYYDTLRVSLALCLRRVGERDFVRVKFSEQYVPDRDAGDHAESERFISARDSPDSCVFHRGARLRARHRTRGVVIWTRLWRSALAASRAQNRALGAQIPQPLQRFGAEHATHVVDGFICGHSSEFGDAHSARQLLCGFRRGAENGHRGDGPIEGGDDVLNLRFGSYDVFAEHAKARSVRFALHERFRMSPLRVVQLASCTAREAAPSWRPASFRARRACA